MHHMRNSQPDNILIAVGKISIIFIEAKDLSNPITSRPNIQQLVYKHRGSASSVKH